MSALEPVQMERLREIGDLLRQKREAKGMALEDASAKTLIRPAILKAIEEADIRPLPEPVYLRGFIRRYADLLDLPGLQLADSFPWQPSQVVPAAFVASAVTTVDSVDDQPRRPFSAPRSEAREVAPEPVEANWVQQPEPEPELETVQSDWMGFDSAESGALLPESLPEWEPTLPSTIQAADAWDQSVVSEPARPSSTEPVVPSLEALEVPFSAETQAATDVESGMPLARRPVENDPPAPLPMPRLPQGSAQPEATGWPPALIGVVLAGLGVACAIAFAATSDRSPRPVASSPTPAATATQPTQPPEVPAPEKMPPAPKFTETPTAASTTPAATASPSPAAIAPAAIAPATPTPASTPAATQPPVTSPSPIPTPATPTPATPTPAKPKAGEVSLDIAVKDESAWFFVEVDGQVVYEGIASNYKERVTGKQIRLGSSRPDLLLISVNGEQTKPFGTAAEANQDKEELFVPKP